MRLPPEAIQRFRLGNEMLQRPRQDAQDLDEEAGRYECEVLGDYEKGTLVAVRPTKAQLAAFRDAARHTL